MLKYKKAIKDRIMKLVAQNPSMTITDIHADIMNFIRRLEPWDDVDIERYDTYTHNIIKNYMKALESSAE